VIVNELIPLIDPANSEKYNNGTRVAAAFLLGKFRAVEAVPVLARALANEPEQGEKPDISRYDAPVWTALVRIGRPAVPAMIENIEASDNRILHIKSLDVLYHVLGGKRRVLELLTKLKVQAKDHPEIQRIKASI
jgi:HEAT repeat protein